MYLYYVNMFSAMNWYWLYKITLVDCSKNKTRSYLKTFKIFKRLPQINVHLYWKYTAGDRTRGFRPRTFVKTIIIRYDDIIRQRLQNTCTGTARGWRVTDGSSPAGVCARRRENWIFIIKRVAADAAVNHGHCRRRCRRGRDRGRNRTARATTLFGRSSAETTRCGPCASWDAYELFITPSSSLPRRSWLRRRQSRTYCAAAGEKRPAWRSA